MVRSLLVEGTVCLVDGTLVPTFDWRHRKDLGGASREILARRARRRQGSLSD
ncbi:hypothetical protein AB1484_36310 [Parafrankia sp. FMc6]|uniref:hypothetical protein n=1 Tax=Parafrankia soli TaxID=2599596 RepID=UPI0034D74B73